MYTWSTIQFNCDVFIFQKEENTRTNETLQEKVTELKELQENNQVILRFTKSILIFQRVVVIFQNVDHDV